MSDATFSGAAAGNDTATVKFTVFTETQADIVGMTVDQARKKFSRPFQIPSDAVPKIGKVEVEGDRVIGPNETLIFTKATGEKG